MRGGGWAQNDTDAPWRHEVALLGQRRIVAGYLFSRPTAFMSIGIASSYSQGTTIATRHGPVLCSLRGLPRAQNLAKSRSHRRVRRCTRPTASALAKWLIRAGFCVPHPATRSPGRAGAAFEAVSFSLSLPNLDRADREGNAAQMAKMVKELPSRGSKHPGFRRRGAVRANRLGRGPTSHRSGRWL